MILNTKPKPSKSMGDDQLIPLINVVFLMLIFFMVAGHITRQNPIKLDPPQSINETHNDPDNQVEVSRTADGKLYLGADPVTSETLGEQLKQRFEKAKDKEHFSVLVRVDGDTPVEQLQPLLMTIKEAGLTHVGLATLLIPGGQS